MTYRLKALHRYRAQSGEVETRIHYHVGFIGGLFPEVSSDPAKARTFASKALAEVYARNKLAGRGYRVERATA